MTRQTWEQEVAELQDPATWDADDGFEQQGDPTRRSVVSVPFELRDFTAVAQAARRAGMSTAEFLRMAAIDKANGRLSKPASGRAD